MACKSCSAKSLSDEHKEILQAMATMVEPSACKDIAAAIGQESKKVSCKLTSLKKKGYIQSPVRCKYEITSAGKSAI
ncbi:MAG: ArsR family transcriptional regulator [Thermodesulfobacteriota bacterium]